MRCEKCKNYIPEGLGIINCPNCGAKIIEKQVILETKKNETDIDRPVSKFNQNNNTNKNSLNANPKSSYSINNTKKRKIIWISATVLTFALFFFLIPTKIYNITPTFFSIFGAALFTFFLFQTIINFKSYKEFNSGNNRKYIPFLVIPFLVMIFVFLLHFDSREELELKLYGEKVKGIIIESKSLKTRSGAIYTIKVKFKTSKGKTIIVNENVGEIEYAKAGKGQTIDLIYSKKNPYLIDLLSNESSIRVYTGSEEREIMPNDLIELLNTDSSQIEKKLHKIMYGWEFDSINSLWINKRKNTTIEIEYGTGLKCTTFGSFFMRFPDKFKELGFKKIKDENKKVMTFASDEYLVNITGTLDGATIGSITNIIRK